VTWKVREGAIVRNPDLRSRIRDRREAAVDSCRIDGGIRRELARSSSRSRIATLVVKSSSKNLLICV
jgi:hypothetical protein